MGQFLYYIPKVQTPDAAEKAVQRHVLGYAFDHMAIRPVSKGPCGNGAGGVLSSDDATAGYYPERQVWEQVPDKDVWIGMYKDDQPTPADLQRSVADQISLFFVKLGDGNNWRIPTARLYPDGSLLPKVRKYAPGGQIVRDIKPEYRELYLAADEVWEAQETGADMTEARVMEIAELALRTCYRVSFGEINMLALIDDINWKPLVNLLISWPMWPDETPEG